MLSNTLTKPAVLIGDLVASRHAPSRAALHDDLIAALGLANEASHPAEPLAPTVGDEFQAVFHTLGDALFATLLVRASMKGTHDVRFGLGVGDVVVLGEVGARFRQQDGPGWWAARDAIEYVASSAARRDVPRTLRTWIGAAPPEHARGQQTFTFLVEHSTEPVVRALNAHLVTRDHLVSEMDGRDRRILSGLLLGDSVTRIAEREGITPSAVSQRAQRSGAAQIVFAQKALR